MTLAGDPITQEAPNLALPPSWCVVSCEQGCRETWTVDVADFDPPLSVADVKRLLYPLLIAHEARAHGGGDPWWDPS